MWSQFIFENLHFAINFLTALVMFAVFWLYFDAWLEKKTRHEIFKLSGFILLSISFVVHAANLTGIIVDRPLVSPMVHDWLLGWTRALGYGLLIIGLWLEPLQPRPKSEGLTKESWMGTTNKAAGIFSLPGQLGQWLGVNFFWLAGIVSGLYLRRSTVGLERHLKPVAAAFGLIAISELISLRGFFRQTDNVEIYNLVKPYGPLWITEHLLLLVGTWWLGRWVWQYLLTRLQSQLFMIFTSATLIIFLITTVVFTGLLLKSLQDETLSRLATDVKVLNLSLDTQQRAILSDAQVVATDNRLLAALSSQGDLAKFARDYLLNKGMDSLVVINPDGQVIARGEDISRVGEAKTDDPLVQKVLLGEEAASIMVRQGPLVPEIVLQAATPVSGTDGLLKGVVLAERAIDNAFVEGIKKATGLEAGIYGQQVLAASTIVAGDGQSRWVGITTENEAVVNRVLREGETFTGSEEIFNLPYFVVYAPLKDADDVPVGMMFVGKPQVSVIQAAGRALEMTFVVAAVLIVLMVIPAYYVSRYIVYQLK